MRPQRGGGPPRADTGSVNESPPAIRESLGSGTQDIEAHIDLLRAFLGPKQWQAADEVTGVVLLTLAGRRTEGWLRTEDIGRFPGAELGRIDRLWREASGDRFGLSVHRQIWSKVAVKREGFDEKDLRAFGDRVGWRVNGEWLETYRQLRFSADAPEGHLPSLRFQTFEHTSNWWEDWRSCIKGFLLRADG